MKTLPLILICCMGSILTGQSEKRTHAAYGKTIPYRLFLPQNYDALNKYPMILMLHGGMCCSGTDNEKHIEVMGTPVWAVDSVQQKYPSFVLVPQSPYDGGWWPEFDILSDLIMSLLSEFPIDSTCLYITGFSMGGDGTWLAISMMPIRFAAAVPMAGTGYPEIISKLDHIPAIWAFQGLYDNPEGPRAMIQAVENASDIEAVYPVLKDGKPSGLSEAGFDSLLQVGAKLIYTETEEGHFVHTAAEKDPKLHKWLFSQSTDFVLPQTPKTSTTYESSEFYHISDGPVFSPGNTGAWDGSSVSEPSVIKDGDTLKMWYVGWESGWSQPARIGYAWSLDGVDWHRYNKNPVLSPSLGWEGYRINKMCVIKDEETYKIWYSANDKVAFSTAIGYATSLDGISWTKNQQAVLLPGGSDDWDNFNIALGTVIKEDGHYKMWYHGGTWPTGAMIGLATSPDGITWTKYDDPATQESPYHHCDPVLIKGRFMEDWDFHSVWYPAVLKTTSGYKMWYSGSNIGSPGYICYATSPDGINWKKSESNPVLLEPPSWSFIGTGYNGSSIVHFNDEDHLWYGLYDPVTGQSAIGYARDFSTIAHADSLKINSNFLNPGKDTLYVRARVINPPKHSLNVVTNITSNEQSVDVELPLSDSDDGIWSAVWPVPEGSQYYTVTLTTVDLDSGTVCKYPEDKKITTIGPVKAYTYTNLRYSEAIKRQYLKIAIVNTDPKTSVENITAELKTNDSRVAEMQSNPMSFDDLAAGASDTCKNLYSFYYAEDFGPEDTKSNPLKFDLVIYSNGYPYWISQFDYITGIESEIITTQPLTFALSQNYPNPFNPKTMINYQLPISSKVELSIYNLLGQKVVTLVDKKQSAGSYQVQWNATGFAGGVYFYRLRTDNGFVQTKKLLLLK